MDGSRARFSISGKASSLIAATTTSKPGPLARRERGTEICRCRDQPEFLFGSSTLSQCGFYCSTLRGRDALATAGGTPALTVSLAFVA